MIRNVDRQSVVETHVVNSEIVDRDHSTFQLSSNFQTQVLVGSKNTGTKTISGAISNLNCFFDIVVADKQGNWRKH